jgi:hypothetical protein
MTVEGRVISHTVRDQQDDEKRTAKGAKEREGNIQIFSLSKTSNSWRSWRFISVFETGISTTCRRQCRKHDSKRKEVDQGVGVFLLHQNELRASEFSYFAISFLGTPSIDFGNGIPTNRAIVGAISTV